MSSTKPHYRKEGESRVMGDRKQRITDILLETGFSRVGYAGAGPFEHSENFDEWLSRGYHGEMSYLARDPARRKDATRIREWARSVIVVALDYNTQNPRTPNTEVDGERGWISRYAWGDDYHIVIEKMFKGATRRLTEEVGGQFRYYVDHGPVMEKLAAREAGLGWMGKNTLLIHPKAGSFFFLAAVLTDLELEPDGIQTDHCGSCTRCLDICPTDAFPAPYVLDATRCISYLTIEHRGDVSPDLEEKIGNHIFGCDLCQDVCPWNRKSPVTDAAPFQPRPGFVNPVLSEWEEMDPEEFRLRASKSPLKRKKYEGIQTNIQRVQVNALRPEKEKQPEAM